MGTRLRFGEEGWERFGARQFVSLYGLIEGIKRRLTNLAYLSREVRTALDEQLISAS